MNGKLNTALLSLNIVAMAIGVLFWLFNVRAEVLNLTTTIGKLELAVSRLQTTDAHDKDIAAVKELHEKDLKFVETRLSKLER